MSKIVKIYGREVIDSRGNPTVQVECWTKLGAYGSAMVPSGASTGEREALELRDGDSSRYLGKGVLKAVSNVNDILAKEIVGMEVTKQVAIDERMLELDGTEFKSNLGANAILGISLAVMRAAANELQLPLYQYIGGINATKLPVPMLNIINGGEHADNTIDFQEFMIMPVGAKSFKEAIRMSSETFHNLKKILASKGHVTAVGDEGGFAPNLKSTEEALDVIVEAIEKAGYTAGKDGIMIAMDCASSEIYDADRGVYSFKGEAEANGKDEVIRTTDELVDYLDQLVDKYPIISIEDGFGERDWEGFKKSQAKSGHKVQLVGDDLYVTNPKITAEGIEQQASNSILIKLNQIGTVTETLRTIQMAHKAGWTTVVSHRSGETEDSTIADLAVGLNTGQIKTGSMSRSDRIAKYNRLLAIEDELGNCAEYDGLKSFYNLKNK